MIDFTEKNEFHTMDFDDLKHTCLDCQKCSLSETRQNVVFGTGPVPCDLMAIGEGPGEQEDNSGIPFVGRAGQLLTKIIESVGLNREVDCYITNIVKCVPPKNRPRGEEIKNCSFYLKKEITNMKNLEKILALGRDAFISILNFYKLSKKENRFSHNKKVSLPHNKILIGSYHCSRYNTNTKRLTEKMFADVINELKN